MGHLALEGDPFRGAGVLPVVSEPSGICQLIPPSHLVFHDGDLSAADDPVRGDPTA